MIDFMGLWERFPAFWVASVVLGLLLGVPYLLHITFERIQRQNNNEK